MGIPWRALTGRCNACKAVDECYTRLRYMLNPLETGLDGRAPVTRIRLEILTKEEMPWFVIW